MSPRIMEEALNGAKQMYESGDIAKTDYLNVLRSFDTEKIPSTPENDIKKQELRALIDNALSSVE